MAEELLKEPLPEPWTFGVTSDGRVFFINDDEQITTWLHPDTRNPVRTGFRPLHDLPGGWECGFTEDGVPYYIDHNNHSTSFQNPDELSPKSKSKRQSEQKQDTSTVNHSYVNVDDNPGQEKKKRRGSFRGFQSGISLFRRSSSKVRKSEQGTTEKPPRKEKKEKMKIEKKTKAARPASAKSVRSTSSIKMQASGRDKNKQISKSGWLYKQDSTGKMKMWRKRWFILADFCLYYFKDDTENEILGNIILPSYTVSTLTSDDRINRKYSFKVEHAGMRTYYFSADSYNEMAEWITALGKSCSPASPLKKKEEKIQDDFEVKRDSSSEDDSDSLRGKKRDSSESRKKSKQNEVPDDSEFGFHHVVPSSSQTPEERETSGEKMSANQSTNNNKYDPEIMRKNGQLCRDPHSLKEERIQKHKTDMSPRRKVEDHHQQKYASPSSPVPAFKNNEQEVMAAQVKVPLKNTSQGQLNSQSRQSRPTYRQGEPNRQHNMQLRQPAATSQKNARRENGESAYFSDTSGATDSSRCANSSDRSNTNRAQNQNDQQNPIKRQNSLAKLGNWVINQRMRQNSQGTLTSPQQMQPPSNFDTASEFSSVSQQPPRKSATLQTGRGRTAPPSSRRYRSRTYNEYMDPMEVASSVISMPPIQHRAGNKMYVAHSMPRPSSSENINKVGQSLHSVPEYGRKQDRRMVSSKSAGNIVSAELSTRALSSPRSVRPVEDPTSIKRAKSDYVYQDMDDFEKHYISNFKRAQQMEQIPFRASKQQHKQQQQMVRPHSEGRQVLRENRPNGSTSNSSSGGVTPKHSRNVTPRSNKAPRYEDVFTPRSDISSMSSASNKHRKNGQVFQFDSVDAVPSRSNMNYSNENHMSPTKRDHPPSSLSIPDQNHARKTSASASGVEVKQIQKGQLRAFVLSAKSPQQSLPPPQRQTPLKASNNISTVNSSYGMNMNDREIEIKLKKLQEFEKAFDKISTDMANLRQEKERLIAELGIIRLKIQTRHSPGSDRRSQLESECRQIEQKLEHVNTGLQTATKRLISMKSKNEDFNTDIQRLKSQVLNELKNQRSMADDVYHRSSTKTEEMKRKLEWELGRIEFILEGLRKNKQKVFEKLQSFDGNRKDDTNSMLMTPRTPTSLVSASSGDMRSPRRLSGNRPSYSSTSSGGTPSGTPVKKYFTLPGRGITPAKSVDALTAESLVRSSRPTSARSVSSIGSSSTNLHRTKSAAERLFNAPYNNVSYDHEARKLKKLQKDIVRDRQSIFKTSAQDTLRRYSNPSGMTLPARSQMKVGTDVQMALKQHRMPKVLQRAKRGMAEKQMLAGMTNQVNENYNGRDDDTESDEIQVDVNLTHQLIAPEKVEIPERYIEYENVELSPAEEKMKHRKVAAIEKMLAKSGHQASLPAVHLAAALAVEAGSVARAVAMNATANVQQQRTPGDGQKDGMERPVTDGSSSAGEDQELLGQSPLRQDPEHSEAYIV